MMLVCIAGWGASSQVHARSFSVNPSVLVAIEQQYGSLARERVEGWQELIVTASASQQDSMSLQRLANDFFNQVPWLFDIDHWGVEDYWATPVETLSSYGGDCEDFSIGKYVTLIESGVDDDKLRITYVKAKGLNQAHMVLAWYETPAAEPLILDNLNKTILPASQRSDLVPVYSFNGTNLWLAKSRGRQLKADSQQALPKWRALNERLQEELQVN